MPVARWISRKQCLLLYGTDYTDTPRSRVKRFARQLQLFQEQSQQNLQKTSPRPVNFSLTTKCVAVVFDLLYCSLIVAGFKSHSSIRQPDVSLKFLSLVSRISDDSRDLGNGRSPGPSGAGSGPRDPSIQSHRFQSGAGEPGVSGVVHPSPTLHQCRGSRTGPNLGTGPWRAP